MPQMKNRIGKKMLLGRRIALSLWVLLLASPACGAVAFVQQATNTATNASSVVVTLGANPGAGSALVAFIGSDSSTPSLSGGGVTWVSGINQAGTNVNEYIFYGLNSSGSGTSITISGSSGSDWAVNVSEFSGVAASSALDVTAGTNGNSTSPSTSSITTTNANDLLLGGFGDAAGTSISSGPTNSFTALTTATATGKKTQGSAYRIVSATATYSTGWTLSASDNWAGAIISLKASGGAAPAPKRLTTLGVG